MFFTNIKKKIISATGEHLKDVIIHRYHKQKFRVCVSSKKCKNDNFCINLAAYKVE